MTRRTLLGLAAGSAVGMAGAQAAGAQRGGRAALLFAPANLVAWCIVPFDAKRRNPEERAEMMKRLGFRRFAYDWREEHLPTLDREVDALQKNGISLDAFWLPAGQEPEKERHISLALDLCRRRGLKTQFWVMAAVPEAGNGQEKRVELAVQPLKYVATEADKIGCKVALYNHGGWFGEPENQIAIIERLKMPNVGIVYNFHHGHAHIDRFPELMRKMKPHLMALNINGMRKEGPEILPVGQGDRELEMLRTVIDSGYRGPIGILGHRAELDAEEALRLNLDGLKTLKAALS
jgi:sugar phosphate isomerase/epimerase